jgi:hypothetical protein
MDDFSKPKIVWSDIATEPSFVYMENHIYMNNTCYMIVGAQKGLIGFLNSKIMSVYFSFITAGLGGKGSRYFKQYVELTPLPAAAEIYIAIDRLLVVQQYNKIDQLLADYYKLTYEEKQYLLSSGDA